MFSRLMRLLVVVLLSVVAMAGTATISTGINLGSAQDSTPEPGDCQAEQMELPGYRELKPEEVAWSMPPIDDVVDCDDPLTFYRELWTEVADEPMTGRFPNGKIGFYAISGAFKMTLIAGSGTVYDCDGVGGSCTPQDVNEENVNQTFDILEGDSFILAGDPVEFVIEEPSQASGGGVRTLLTHNGSHARVSGSTDKGGGYSAMGCDSGGCY